MMTFSSLTFQIGAFAAPDKIHWAPGLPKTRSGKIMRRILRKIASRQLDELGDTSTLADPNVVNQLIELADSWSPKLCIVIGMRNASKQTVVHSLF